MSATEKEPTPSRIDDPIEARRWRVRRRFAIIAFVELIAAPLWVYPLYKSTTAEFAEGVFSIMVLALVGIIGGYVGGVVIDDNLRRKSR